MSTPRPIRRRRMQGMTLVEVMAASAILAVALLGLTGSHVVAATRIMASGKTAQATALAQEMAGLLGTIQYTSSSGIPSGLLANTNTANDLDITDTAGAMDSASVVDPLASGLVDHVDSQLPAQLLGALTPVNATDPTNTTIEYQRYWTVAPIADPIAPGSVGGVAIAAIVRYRVNGAWRHVAVVTTRFDQTQLRR